MSRRIRNEQDAEYKKSVEVDKKKMEERKQKEDAEKEVERLKKEKEDEEQRKREVRFCLFILAYLSYILGFIDVLQAVFLPAQYTHNNKKLKNESSYICLLYTSPSPRDS